MKIIEVRTDEGEIKHAKKSKNGRYCVPFGAGKYASMVYLKQLPFGWKEIKEQKS